MKRMFLDSLLFLITIFFCACSNDLAGNESGTFISLSSDVTTDYIMWAEQSEYKTTDERIMLLFKRQDGEAFQYYEPYNVYKLVDDKWVLLSFRVKEPFHDLPYTAMKSDSQSDAPAQGFQYIYLEDWSIEPSKGQYKIVKEFNGKCVSCELVIT